jgi:hypothetical protein
MSLAVPTAESHPLQQQRAALQAMMASLGEISPPQLELLELRSPLGHKILACVNYGVDTDLLSAAHGLMTEVFGGLPTQPWLQELDDMSDMKAKSQLDPSSAEQLSAHIGKRSDGWQPLHAARLCLHDQCPTRLHAVLADSAVECWGVDSNGQNRKRLSWICWSSTFNPDCVPCQGSNLGGAWHMLREAFATPVAAPAADLPALAPPGLPALALRGGRLTLRLAAAPAVAPAAAPVRIPAPPLKAPPDYLLKAANKKQSAEAEDEDEDNVEHPDDWWRAENVEQSAEAEDEDDDNVEHPDAQAEDEDCWPEDEDCWPEPRRGLHPDAQAEDEDWWPEGEEPRVKTIKVRKTIMRFQAAPVRIPAPPLKAPPGSQGAKGTGKGTKGDVAKRLRDMMATGKGKDLRKALAVSKAKAATAPWKHGSFWC